jgi:hypothetical protein
MFGTNLNRTRALWLVAFFLFSSSWQFTLFLCFGRMTLPSLILGLEIRELVYGIRLELISWEGILLLG